MRLLKLLRFLPALGLAAVALGQTTYSQQVTTIRAGVLLLDGNTTAGTAPVQQSNSTPFVWYNLDGSPVKPAGWTFLNPSASSQATDAMNARWTALSAVVGGSAPTAGDRLTKSEAGYWEVFLSGTSDETLASFDVLSVSLYDKISLSPLERERLRRFVDQGGVLWVDLRTNVAPDYVDFLNPLPLALKLDPTAAAGPLSLDYLSPLLNQPNVLDNAAISSAQVIGSGNLLGITDGDLGALTEIEETIPGDIIQMHAVAADSTGVTLGMAKIGDGYLVVTARGTATAANQAISNDAYQANNQFYALTPTYDLSALSADKLLINAISLPTSRQMGGGGSRQRNGSPVDVGAPLLKRFDAPLTAGTPGTLNNYPPALYKGLVVVSVNDGASSHIYVYNAKPGADVDGTGTGDKGIADFKYGQPMDLIWKSEAIPNGPISSPTCFQAVGGLANGATRDQVVVTAADGTLYSFPMYPTGALTSVVPEYTIVPGGGPGVLTTGVPGEGPYAPTYHEGWLFVADSQPGISNPYGRLWVADPSSATEVKNPLSLANFEIGGTAAGVAMNDISASPTVGYIPIQDNSGGVDKVVYVPTRPTTLGGDSSTAGLTSIWFGAKGEKPISASVTASDLVLTTRANAQTLSIFDPRLNPTDPGVSRLGVKLTMVHANGAPYTELEMAAIFTGTWSQVNGILYMDIVAGQDATLNTAFANGDGVRVDYTIDWTVSGATNQAIRGSLYFPDDHNHTRRVIGNLALSDKAVLFASVSSQDTGQPGGDLYALSENGRGTFRLLYRYSLYDLHTLIQLQTGPQPYRELFKDYDGVTSFAAPLQGSITNLTLMSPPAVQGSEVYVTAKGVKNGLVPVTVMMALKSDPEPVEIRTGDLNSGFQLIQEDTTTSTDRSNPASYNLLAVNQFTYTHDPNASFGLIHMDSLMSSVRGKIQNAFSTSQAIIIRNGANPDQLVEPSRDGTWSPLLWYSCFNGYSNSTAPVVTGPTLFFAGNSMLPSILTSSGFTAKGLLFAMNSDISVADPLNIPDPDRPWEAQVPMINNSNGFQVNPNMRWPQVVGVTDINSYTMRLLQTQLDSNATDALGLVAGEGTVASVGAELDPTNTIFTGPYTALHAFGLADFMIADEGRLARFDSTGNVLFSSDASLQTGPEGDISSVGDVHRLVRPVRAYPISSTDMIVVDPPSNRLSRMSVSGREIRSIDTILLDPSDPNDATHKGFRPEGFNTNEPLTFNHPSDAATYSEYVTVQTDPSTSTLGYQHTDGSFTHLALATVFPLSGARIEQAGDVEYWPHYIVADSGNKRLVDLIDRYQADPTTGQVIGGPLRLGTTAGPITSGTQATPQVGVLFSHSPAVFTGKNWNYNSVARVFIPGSGPNPDRYVVAAGVGSSTTTSTDIGMTSAGTTSEREEGTGNGGIVVFDGANSQVISSVAVPAEPAGVRYDYGIPGFTATGRPARTLTNPTNPKKLSGLTSVTMRNVPDGASSSKLAIMFTDASGVYEIMQTGPTTWAVDWMFTNDAYKVLRTVNAPFGGSGEPSLSLIVDGSNNPIVGPNPLGLHASFARRLPSNEVLIVNSYTGSLRSGDKFYGEVLQVNGDTDPNSSFSTQTWSSDNTVPGFSFNKVNWGFGTTSMRFVLPPIQGTRGIRTPVFADRR